MKINLLLFSPHTNQIGGVVEYLNTLSKSFSSNVQCQMFFIGRRNGHDGLLSKIRVLLSDCRHLVRMLSENKFDVVQINPSLKYYSLIRDGIFLTILRLAKIRNVVVFFHGWDNRVENTLSGNIFYQWVFEKIFGWPPVIYVLANKFKTTLGSYNFELKNIYTTTTMFDGVKFVGIYRSRGDKNIRILFMSRMNKEKGVFELLESMEWLFCQNDGVELIMAGDGDEYKQLKSLVEKRNLTGRATLPGFVAGNEKYQMLTDADIFVLPTYYGEGCPVALLEAMAAGLPIITTSAGGIGDILKDGVNGLIVEPASSEALKKALVEVIDNDSMRRRMGIYNREIAWEEYEATIVGERIEKMYMNLTRQEMSE